MKPILVEVDVQRDFCEPTGALHVPGSPNEVFRSLTRRAMAERIPIVGSLDSHAFDAWEFASSDRKGPGGEDPRFPQHCIKGTSGWLKLEGTLPERFRIVPNVATLDLAHVVAELADGVAQAVYFEKEVYSLFANPLAEHFLGALSEMLGVRPTFFVYGVATDYCVRAAALGLAARGHRTTLLTDAVVGLSAEGVARTLRELRDAGVALATVNEALGAGAPPPSVR
jgi:nicotinamidase/pyrazinamidase